LDESDKIINGTKYNNIEVSYERLQSETSDESKCSGRKNLDFRLDIILLLQTRTFLSLESPLYTNEFSCFGKNTLMYALESINSFIHYRK
jgi:hypothetical protein